MNGREEQEWAESAVSLCASLEKCLPAKRQVRAQHAQSRDAALSRNGRPLYLCFVQSVAGSCCKKSMPLAAIVWLSHWLGATLQVVWHQLEDGGSLWWTTSWRLRGHYILHSWAASPFWKGNRSAVSLWVPHGEQYTSLWLQFNKYFFKKPSFYVKMQSANYYWNIHYFFLWRVTWSSQMHLSMNSQVCLMNRHSLRITVGIQNQAFYPHCL